ncbi:hypothetical protein [Rhodococcus sp. NPDC004095]
MAAVDYRETLVTYLRSETTGEAAKTLGISPASLAARIKILRKAGVKVPKKTGRRSGLTQIEVAQLNSIINRHEREAAKAS